MDARATELVTARAGLDLASRVRGVFVKLGALEVIDLVAQSPLDFAVVDLEHSQLDEGDARRLVRHARAVGLPALVRLPAVDAGAVNRILEAGALGIQLSTVRRADQVRALRRACRYAPAGTRSVSLTHPMAGYGGRSLAEYVAEQQGSPLVVAQIETATTDDELSLILDERPDVVFLGLADLTVDLAFDRERLEARVEEVIDAVQERGLLVGAAGLDDARVDYDVSVSDVSLLRERLNELGVDDINTICNTAQQEE